MTTTSKEAMELSERIQREWRRDNPTFLVTARLGDDLAAVRLDGRVVRELADAAAEIALGVRLS